MHSASNDGRVGGLRESEQIMGAFAGVFAALNSADCAVRAQWRGGGVCVVDGVDGAAL